MTAITAMMVLQAVSGGANHGFHGRPSALQAAVEGIRVHTQVRAARLIRLAARRHACSQPLSPWLC
jgi:hypothetical protein